MKPDSFPDKVIRSDFPWRTSPDHSVIGESYTLSHFPFVPLHHQLLCHYSTVSDACGLLDQSGSRAKWSVTPFSDAL